MRAARSDSMKGAARARRREELLLVARPEVERAAEAERLLLERRRLERLERLSLPMLARPRHGSAPIARGPSSETESQYPACPDLRLARHRASAMHLAKARHEPLRIV